MIARLPSKGGCRRHTAKKVAGRKNIVNTAIAFIEVLSRFVATAVSQAA